MMIKFSFRRFTKTLKLKLLITVSYLMSQFPRKSLTLNCDIWAPLQKKGLRKGFKSMKCVRNLCWKTTWTSVKSHKGIVCIIYRLLCRMLLFAHPSQLDFEKPSRTIQNFVFLHLLLLLPHSYMGFLAR